MKKNPSNLAALIDHTMLKADASQTALIKLCHEARTHSFYSVCVNPRWLPLICKELQNTKVLPITVVGFPLGASLHKSKGLETEQCLIAGAQEIDMVIDLGALKSSSWKEVEADIKGVVGAANKKPVKVILESCLLTDQEIIDACKVTVQAGAQFVKTSTGFSASGATAHHIRLMRETVGPDFGVKASGGIRNYTVFKEMYEAGANRIGSSASVEILREAQNG